jgi:hypothetical protein
MTPPVVDRQMRPRSNTVAQPFIKPHSAAAARQARDASPQLCEGDYAEKGLILVNLGEPRRDAFVGLWPDPLRYNVRVE